MSKYQVTASEMSSAISDLTSSNNEFKSRVTELEAKQQELAGMWQGDANTTFNNAFQSDKEQWTAFATLIDQYIEALSKILQTYQEAEQTNNETARNRTY